MCPKLPEHPSLQPALQLLEQLLLHKFAHLFEQPPEQVETQLVTQVALHEVIQLVSQPDLQIRLQFIVQLFPQFPVHEPLQPLQISLGLMFCPILLEYISFSSFLLLSFTSYIFF